MENGLTFRTDPTAPGCMAASFVASDGAARRNAVRLGKSIPNEAAAKAALRAWARESGWNG